MNLIEPDEEIVICINGYFGERMYEMALRAGAKPIRVECKWGAPVDLEKARIAWRESKARVLFAVHAETSTGVLQQIEVWRVGLMGAGSVENNVLLLLGALEKCMKDEGFKVKDSGVSAAAAFYAGN